MSIVDQIHALEVLAALDTELKSLEEVLGVEKSTLANLKANVTRLSERLQIDRTALAASEKSRNEAIADVRSMNQQIEHSRDKLGRSRTEREVNAAQREMEELRKLIRDREEEVGRLTAAAEASRQHIEATEDEHNKYAAELLAKENEILEKVVVVEKDRNAKHAEREAASKALPPVLYRRYDAVRQKRGIGIAQTTDGTCKACHIALPPQLFHRLRREPTLDQCPSCNRIIYFAAPPALPTSAS